MMRTLCIAVVVLSLTSVCQPASLACDRLLKPADKSPDLSGRWYLIAMSSDVCVVSLVHAVFLLSLQVDITLKDSPNIYSTNFKGKIYGYCTTESETFLYENNTMFDVDSNNAPTGVPDVLLQSGCSDCLVVKGDDIIPIFLLLSKRKTVTADELKEFETQSECLGWSKPQVFHVDHDYENCPSLDDDNTDVDTSGLSQLIYQRLKITYKEPLKCLAETFLYYPRAVFQWAQQLWSEWDSLWSPKT